LTAFFLERGFEQRRSISANVHRGFGGFSEIALLARMKKYFFVMADTLSFSAKRTGRKSGFGKTEESGSGSPGMGNKRELAENRAILKINVGSGVGRSSWQRTGTGKLSSPEKRKLFYLQGNGRCPISILGKV
jgi:hypothetical protein